MKIATTILFLMLAAVARADSIETADKLIVYGHVEQMDKSFVTFIATFPSTSGIVSKKLSISRTEIVKIEFNATTFNPGGPPGVGARPSIQTKDAVPRVGQDVAVLVDGHRQPCDGATIDLQTGLHCGKRNYPKGSVIRIFLARE